MVTTVISEETNKQFADNGIKEAKFISLIIHAIHPRVYGAVFETEKGLVFMQHKWVEINKDKKPPKVVSKETAKLKFIENTDGLEFCGTEEHSERWIQDYRQTG